MHVRFAACSFTFGQAQTPGAAEVQGCTSALVSSLPSASAAAPSARDTPSPADSSAMPVLWCHCQQERSTRTSRFKARGQSKSRGPLTPALQVALRVLRRTHGNLRTQPVAFTLSCFLLNVLCLVRRVPTLSRWQIHRCGHSWGVVKNNTAKHRPCRDGVLLISLSLTWDGFVCLAAGTYNFLSFYLSIYL